MKAVFLLQTDPFLPKPALRALREADALRRAGWEVIFVSWIKDGASSSTAPEGAYPVRRVLVPVPPLGTSLLGRALAYGRASRGLRDAAVAERPDLLVAHDFEVLRAAVAARRRTHAPLLYDSHEDWPALIAENSWMEARIAGFQERRLCRRVDHVVTVSEPIASKFRGWAVPTSVLYSARPSAEVHPADRGTARRSFGYAADDFVVGFAGSLGPGRGLEILLDAQARAPENVKVLVVGGPEGETERLRARAVELGLGGRVRVDGYRPFADLAPYYAAMDLGVILLDNRPNHRRAMPNKLFDYMAHGVAVLAPRYPAMAGVVESAGCGWTVPSVSPGAVVDVLAAVREPGAAASRGRAGRDAYLREYAWEQQEARFLGLVEQLRTRPR